MTADAPIRVLIVRWAREQDIHCTLGQLEALAVAVEPRVAAAEARADLLQRQADYLRSAVAECVGYTLTGNVDDDDAELVDRLAEQGAAR